MKNQLRKGGANALNITASVSFLPGFCQVMVLDFRELHLPTSYASALKDDDVVLSQVELPPLTTKQDSDP